MNGIEYKSFVIHDNTLIDRVDLFFKDFDTQQGDEFEDLMKAQKDSTFIEERIESFEHTSLDEIERMIENDYDLEHNWKWKSSRNFSYQTGRLELWIVLTITALLKMRCKSWKMKRLLFLSLWAP